LADSTNALEWATLSDPDRVTGVRVVWLDEQSETAGRLFLSSGTQLAAQQPRLGEFYEVGARVPAGPWAPALGGALVRENWIKGSSIGLAQMAETAVRPIMGALAEARVDRPEVRRDLVGLIDGVVEYLCRRFGIEEQPTIHGLSYHQPNLPTTTVNHKSGKFLGLHLDSWDQLPFALRHKARVRLSVNLGQSSRYLLFLGLTAAAVHGACVQAGLLVEDCQPTPIGRSFMARWPECPIVRLEVPPGYAYVAPTDNVYHDGSSIGTEIAGWHLTVRGFFEHI
jgi:hypothetical protein